MNRGVIYVLTNPAFPEYVKIGYADNLEGRLKQLNRSECLPFAFRAYCVYEVPDRLRDKDVHAIIDKQIAEEDQNSGKVLYTEQDHFVHSSTTTRRLYEEIKNRILDFGDVIIEPKKLYIAFKRKTNFCDIELQRNKLKIFINMPKGSLCDANNIARDVSATGHWGNGDYQIDLSDEDLLNSAI